MSFQDCERYDEVKEKNREIERSMMKLRKEEGESLGLTGRDHLINRHQFPCRQEVDVKIQQNLLNLCY